MNNLSSNYGLIDAKIRASDKDLLVIDNNMDKRLIVPKWVLINWPKLPQTPQNVPAQIVSPSPKVWDFYEKRFYYASVVRGLCSSCTTCLRKHSQFCRIPVPI